MSIFKCYYSSSEDEAKISLVNSLLNMTFFAFLFLSEYVRFPWFNRFCFSLHHKSTAVEQYSLANTLNSGPSTQIRNKL